MNQLTIAFILACAIALSGCATVLHGTSETIQLSSTPSEAEVLIDDRPACKTPCAVDLSTESDLKLTLIKPGFQTFETTLSRDFNYWWLVPDIIFGSWVAVLIDGATGSWYTLAPNPVRVTLSPQGSPEPSALLPPPTELEMRQGKDLELTVGIFERAIIGIGGSATFGLYLSPEVILEITTDISAALFVPPLTSQASAYTGGQFKAFSTDSLFVTVGIGVQQTAGQFKFNDSDQLFNSDDVNIRLTDIGPRFGVGNQWQYDRVTLSVEWLSVFLPIQTQSLQINDLDPQQAAAQRAEILRALEDTFRPSVRLMHLQFGLSF